MGFIISLVMISLSYSSSSREDMLKTTGLNLGNYELEEPIADECWDGPLNIIEADKTLTLMLGARPLISGFREGSYTYKERDCNFHNSYEYKKFFISEKREQVCKNNVKRIISTDLKIDKNTIVYTRKILNSDVDRSFSCTLKLKPSNNSN